VSEEKSAREVVDNLRMRLEDEATELARAAQIRNYAMEKIADLVKQGQGILSVTEMARLSGVSRDTIYKILKEGK
jgi:transcriptional regulator of acetoin/glycerol metabolism